MILRGPSMRQRDAALLVLWAPECELCSGGIGSALHYVSGGWYHLVEEFSDKMSTERSPWQLCPRAKFIVASLPQMNNYLGRISVQPGRPRPMRSYSERDVVEAILRLGSGEGRLFSPDDLRPRFNSLADALEKANKLVRG